MTDMFSDVYGQVLYLTEGLQHLLCVFRKEKQAFTHATIDCKGYNLLLSQSDLFIFLVQYILLVAL